MDQDVHDVLEDVNARLKRRSHLMVYRRPVTLCLLETFLLFMQLNALDLVTDLPRDIVHVNENGRFAVVDRAAYFDLHEPVTDLSLRPTVASEWAGRAAQNLI